MLEIHKQKADTVLALKELQSAQKIAFRQIFPRGKGIEKGQCAWGKEVHALEND